MKKIIGYVILVCLGLIFMGFMFYLIPNWQYHVIFFTFIGLLFVGIQLAASKN